MSGHVVMNEVTRGELSPLFCASELSQISHPGFISEGHLRVAAEIHMTLHLLAVTLIKTSPSTIGTSACDHNNTSIPEQQGEQTHQSPLACQDTDSTTFETAATLAIRIQKQAANSKPRSPATNSSTTAGENSDKAPHRSFRRKPHAKHNITHKHPHTPTLPFTKRSHRYAEHRSKRRVDINELRTHLSAFKIHSRTRQSYGRTQNQHLRPVRKTETIPRPQSTTSPWLPTSTANLALLLTRPRACRARPSSTR